MLEVRNIHAGYGALSVLRGIDMTIAEGEVVAVLGSNGVGKTTLNNVMCGLVPHTQGEITFLGESLHGVEANAIVSRGLIQVPEGRYQRAKARRASNLEKILNWFPRLRERLPQLAGTLSGGEQQMLATGRGLMGEPRLLIMDEPSLGLSPMMVQEMFAMIKRIRLEGVTVILIEQNVVQSWASADRADVLENGSFSLSGSAAEIASNPRLKKAYLGL